MMISHEDGLHLCKISNEQPFLFTLEIQPPTETVGSRA